MLTGHYSECTKKLLQHQPSEAVVVGVRAIITLDLHLMSMFAIIQLYSTLNTVKKKKRHYLKINMWMYRFLWNKIASRDFLKKFCLYLTYRFFYGNT